MTVRTRYFDIHDIVRIRLTMPSSLPFGKMVEQKYDAYKCDHINNPNFLVRFGPFVPELEKTIKIRAHSDTYFIKKDYFFGQFSYKGAKWDVQIKGLESDEKDICVRSNLTGVIGFASSTLVNLVKISFLLKGYFPVHGACFEKNGHAFLFPARSGVGKTLLSLHMLKRGYRLLGDDEVFVKDGCIYSHLIPLNLKFVYVKTPEANLSLRVRLGISIRGIINKISLGYLSLLTPVPAEDLFPGQIVHSAKLKSVIQLDLEDKLSPGTLINSGALIRKIMISSLVEASELCRIEDAYSHIYPESLIAGIRQNKHETLEKSFNGLVLKKVILGKVFSKETGILLESMVNSDAHL